MDAKPLLVTVQILNAASLSQQRLRRCLASPELQRASIKAAFGLDFDSSNDPEALLPFLVRA